MENNGLKMITRNNSSVNGKARVFIAYHFNDKNLIEDILKDIFEFQNCAIFYRENYQEEIEQKELEFELSQMSLMVIPITANFLKCDSDAYQKEFKYAIKNNIPVLPLMYGKGLERVFNSACGDLQFLDKFAIKASIPSSRVGKLLKLVPGQFGVPFIPPTLLHSLVK